MKKTLFSITMTVIALSGCAQEELIKISSGAGNGAVSATIVNEDTRTTLTEDGSVYHVNWVNGDKIAVVDGSNATGIFYCDKVDAPYSIFYLCDGDSVKFTDNLKAYYPASISEGKLAPVQIYGADGLFESPMYAEAEATTGDVKLEFKNLCGALKFNVTSSVAGAKVAGIALKADQGMSGEFTIADNAAVIAAKEAGAEFIPYNYTVPLIIFACFGVAALLIALYLKALDAKRHLGLEEPNIQK